MRIWPTSWPEVIDMLNWAITVIIFVSKHSQPQPRCFRNWLDAQVRFLLQELICQGKERGSWTPFFKASRNGIWREIKYSEELISARVEGSVCKMSWFDWLLPDTQTVRVAVFKKLKGWKSYTRYAGWSYCDGVFNGPVPRMKNMEMMEDTEEAVQKESKIRE